MKKVGHVCVFGRANAGKSTLINKILGFNLLPMTSKPQTTRENVKAIYNDDESQIIFVDTPGIFKPHGKLGTILLKTAKSSLEGVDVIVYVVAADEAPNFELTQLLSKIDIPIILAYNKIDKVNVKIGEDRLSRYLNSFGKKAIDVVHLSAKNGYGLDDLLSKIKALLPFGQEEYSTEIVSDRPREYIISEMIREQCMIFLKEEVPHSIFIDIKHIQEEEDRLEIIGDIIVEKDSERGILIGKGGKMISKISQASEKRIYDYFGLPTSVRMLVKTIKDWRNDDRYLKKFGFEE